MRGLARRLVFDRAPPSGAAIGARLARGGLDAAPISVATAAASPVRLSQAGADTPPALGAATGRELAGVGPKREPPRPMTSARIAQKIASGSFLSLAARL
jgi:hypothetical protein